MTDKMKKLIEGTKRPTIDDVLPIAKEEGITDASRLWDLFDKITELWLDLRLG